MGCGVLRNSEVADAQPLLTRIEECGIPVSTLPVKTAIMVGYNNVNRHQMMTIRFSNENLTQEETS